MELQSGVVIVLLILSTFTVMMTKAAIIENMYVPEIVQSGFNDVILCCQYSYHAGNYSVDWLFNGKGIDQRALSVKINEVQGSIWKFSSVDLPSTVKQSLLSFQRVTPEMSGNYTCLLHEGGFMAQQTKHMLVYSPENDFTLKISYLNKNKLIDVKCTAWGLNPKPEITLEVDNRPVSRQVQRVWWKQDSSFTAEGVASLRDLVKGNHEVTCRLHLPQADYTAIMKKYFIVGNEMCCSSHAIVSNAAVLSVAIVFIVLFNRTVFFYK